MVMDWALEIRSWPYACQDLGVSHLPHPDPIVYLCNVGVVMPSSRVFVGLSEKVYRMGRSRWSVRGKCPFR